MPKMFLNKNMIHSVQKVNNCTNIPSSQIRKIKSCVDILGYQLQCTEIKKSPLIFLPQIYNKCMLYQCLNIIFVCVCACVCVLLLDAL
jgi:hypothetical protein